MKIYLTVCMLIVMAGVASAEMTVTLKNGSVMSWQSVKEEGESLCTYKGGGLFCVDKTDVVSVKEEKEEVLNPNTKVIYTKSLATDAKPIDEKVATAKSGFTKADIDEWCVKTDNSCNNPQCRDSSCNTGKSTYQFK